MNILIKKVTFPEAKLLQKMHLTAICHSPDAKSHPALNGDNLHT